MQLCPRLLCKRCIAGQHPLPDTIKGSDARRQVGRDAEHGAASGGQSAERGALEHDVAQEELDLENELADIMSDGSAEELAECLAPAEADERPETSMGSGDNDLELTATAVVDKRVAEALLSELSGIAEPDGAANEIALGAAAASSGAASSSDVAPADPPAPAEAAPWEELSERSALGYFYFRGRSVMRVQRGKPARSVTVSCYRHSRCTMLLTESRCPDDEALKKWLFAVDAPAPGASSAEAKALALEHMALGKGQWSAKPK